jgi:hypothetical protein
MEGVTAGDVWLVRRRCHCAPAPRGRTNVETPVQFGAPAMICIGQSHMACVLFAAQEASISLQAIALKDAHGFDGLEQTAFEVHPTRKTLRPETAKRLREPGPVFSFVGGIAHLSLAIWKHPQPFDFVLPEAPDLPLEPDAELVPSDAMRTVLERRPPRLAPHAARSSEIEISFSSSSAA